ncbi:MAG: EamA family transporter [Lachnospirales bacterium]
MNKYYIFLVILTLLGSGGAFFLKKATSIAESTIGLIFNKYFYIGGILYFLSGLLNIFVLKYLPYTTVLPLTSITYIWTLLLANRYYGESITKNKIIGICLIIFGAFIIGVN